MFFHHPNVKLQDSTWFLCDFENPKSVLFFRLNSSKKLAFFAISRIKKRAFFSIPIIQKNRAFFAISRIPKACFLFDPNYPKKIVLSFRHQLSKKSCFFCDFENPKIMLSFRHQVSKNSCFCDASSDARRLVQNNSGCSVDSFIFFSYSKKFEFEIFHRKLLMDVRFHVCKCVTSYRLLQILNIFNGFHDY